MTWIGMLRAQRPDGTYWRWPAPLTGEDRSALCQKYRKMARGPGVPDETVTPLLLDPRVYTVLHLELYEASSGWLRPRGEIELWRDPLPPLPVKRGRKKRSLAAGDPKAAG